jgi:hypothetical protein
LPLPLSLVHRVYPAPSAVCSFQFLVYYPVFLFLFFFLQRRGHSVQGLCWFIAGVAVGIPHAAYLLTCWPASPKQVWSCHLVAQELPCFLSVMWRGEALYGLGVKGVEVLLILGVFFLPSVGSSVSARF